MKTAEALAGKTEMSSEAKAFRGDVLECMVRNLGQAQVVRLMSHPKILVVVNGICEAFASGALTLEKAMQMVAYIAYHRGVPAA